MGRYPAASGGSSAVAAYDFTKQYAAGDFVRHNNRLWRAPAIIPAGRAPRFLWNTPVALVAGVPINQTLGQASPVEDSITSDLPNWSAGGFPGRGYRLEVVTAVTVTLTCLVLDGGASYNVSAQEYQADGTTFVSAFTANGHLGQATRGFAAGLHFLILTSGAIPAGRDGTSGFKLSAAGGSVVEQWECLGNS